MVWNSLYPDGTKSVKQNTLPGQQNTTYSETTLNQDHFWNIGTNEDGNHKRVSMEDYASTAIGAPADSPIPTGMDGVYYLKPANGRIAGFYRNASGIYQSVPGFISGSVALTTSYQDVVVLPDDCYGQIFFFTTDSTQAMSSGYFKCGGGVCQAYCNSQTIGNSTSQILPMRYGNGDQVSGLNLRVRISAGTVATYQYRVTFWAT